MNGTSSPSYWFVSLQYSAIQKTVLRRDRLWSMAGISQILSRLNEIDLPRLAGTEAEGVTVMVAGGGKFTARFSGKKKAAEARAEIIKTISTTLPMLEFQASEISDEPAPDFESAKAKGIIDSLGKQKDAFRGYGCSFNPHFMLCEECGEYPATREVFDATGKKVFFCATCAAAKEAAPNLNRTEADATTIEKIYRGYLKSVYPHCRPPDIPKDFENLFQQEGEETKEPERKRMAVWCSDLNNMNQKVPIWLSQDEDKLLDVFNEVKDVYIRIVVEALQKTFPALPRVEEPRGKKDCLPFRLIVAGGDDLCLVMDEKYILSFVENLAESLDEQIGRLKETDYLHETWLNNHRDKTRARDGEKIKPYSFGGAFVVTSIHTPFQRIHEVCEDLMKEAKVKTDRLGNSVNWRVMAEDASVTDRLIHFEKPLYVKEEKEEEDKSGEKKKQYFADSLDRLSFSTYMRLMEKYRKISSSHRIRIIDEIQKPERDGKSLERWLKQFVAAELDKSESKLIELLLDPDLRNKANELMPERIATLFELMEIGG